MKAAPSGWSLMTGGVFFEATSSNGSTTHSGRMCIVIVLVCPLTTSVHVSVWFAKLAGALKVKTPHWRPV